MGERFDDVARVLATPMPRRRALGLVAGAIGGAALGAFRPGPARAQGACEPPREECLPFEGTCCDPTIGESCCGDGCCHEGTECCDDGSGGSTCCPPGQICQGFGTPQATCVPGQQGKCKPNQRLCGNHCCKPDDSCCTFTDKKGRTKTRCCPKGKACCGEVCCPQNHTCCTFTDKKGRRKVKCCGPNKVCDPAAGCK
jgi:hypothetical protein